MVIRAKPDGRGRVDFYRLKNGEWVWFTDSCLDGFVESMGLEGINNTLTLSVTLGADGHVNSKGT